MTIRCGITGILMILLIMGSLHPAAAQNDLGKIKCICIDAGHGGKDPGAIGAKCYEKNVVLSVALKLGKLIESNYPDLKVIYIRKKDVFVELRDRTRIANDNKADLFISIHANSLDVKSKPSNKYVKGAETFVLGTNSSEHNLKVAMKENSVIHYEDDYSVNYAGFDPSKAESYILFNMIRNLHLENSVTLASLIQEELVNSAKLADREVRQSPLWVLKDVAMPSTLVEIGYITNSEDERRMMSNSGQDQIAKAIFKGFQKYKDKIERNIVSPIGIGTQENSSNTRPVYAIQVASATSRIKNSANLCKGTPVSELSSGGRFRYYVMPSDNLNQVKASLGKIKNQVKDCFIIAIYEGNVIPIAEARKIEQK